MYLDEEPDRVRARARADFDSMVEAVRVGTIFAHDGRQYSRWRADVARRAGRKPAGSTTIEQLAREFPDHVGLPN